MVNSLTGNKLDNSVAVHCSIAELFKSRNTFLHHFSISVYLLSCQVAVSFSPAAISDYKRVRGIKRADSISASRSVAEQRKQTFSSILHLIRVDKTI